jgi:hypothetical protein
MKYKMHYITNLSRNKQPPKSKLIVSKSPSSFTTKQHSKLTTNGQTSTINTPSVNTPYQISQGNSQRILVEELTGISQYLNTESAEIQQERLETNAQNYLKVLDELNNQGHEIIVITARTEENCNGIEENTKKLLEENNIKISKYYFAQYKKSDIAKKINLDLMIDDSINVYENMKKDNIDCILFDEGKNWIDILEYVNKREV